MAFSLKSLFRREQTEPNGIDRDQTNGAHFQRAILLTDPSHASPRPETERGGIFVPNVNATSFEMPTGKPIPAATSTTPMNTASPFQPAAEEGFTIRELSMLLPPQILNAEQLPPDYLIPLPMEALRATFLAGRPCLRLSQIFQSCPYLFSRQLMPGEDQEVSLPYQKVRRILEACQALPPRAVAAVAAASPFSIRQAAAPMTQPPTLSAEQSPADPVLSPIDSPFKQVASAQSPFAMAQPEPKPTAAASPFTIAQPQAAAAPVAAAPWQTPGAALPESPFKMAPKQPAQPPVAAKASSAAASPFTVADQLPSAPAPRREVPPAFPAPHSSSPFQIAQQPPAPPSALAAPNHPAQMATSQASPFATQSVPPMPTPFPSSLASLAGAQEASPVSAFATQMAEPAAVASQPAAEWAPPAMNSPFVVISSPVAPGSPSPSAPPAVPAPPAPAEPLPPRVESVLPSLVAPGSLLPVPALAPAAPEPAVAEPKPEQTIKAEETRQEISMRLASVLRAIGVEELGFDPTQVPPTVMVTFPLSLIYPQLPSGKVQVGLQDIIQGVAEKFQPAFARANRDLRASLPLSELLHALPSGALPTAPTGPIHPPAPSFETPFQTKATEDAVRVPTPEPINLPPALLPSFITVHDDLGDPRSAATLNDPPPTHLPLRGAVAARPPQPVQAPPPSQSMLPEPPQPAAYIPALPALSPINGQSSVPAPIEPRPTLPPLLIPKPAVPVAEIAPLPEIEQQSTPVEAAPGEPVIKPAPVVAPSPVSQDFQIGYKEHPAAMALRHWLQVTGEMTPNLAVECVAKLPGVQAAVILGPTLMETAGASTDVEAGFYEKSSLRHQSLKMMLENMGQPVQGSFTMRLDRIASTFFLEGDICLAVLQEEVSLAEELRDKLSLVTRELAALTSS